MEEAIYLKEKSGSLFVKTTGHITASLCGSLRERVIERIERASCLEHLYVSLESCEYMDSTFMGLLVGINKKFQKSCGKRVELVKPSSICSGLLQNLGIRQLFEVLENPVPFPERMENVTRGGGPTTEFLMKAHEELMDLSEENRKRFNLLHMVLRKKLQERKEEEEDRES